MLLHIGVSAILARHIGQALSPFLSHLNKHKWQNICMHNGLFDINNIHKRQPTLTLQGSATCPSKFRIQTFWDRLGNYLLDAVSNSTSVVPFNRPDAVLGGLDGGLVK
jgi:hypothetical protein